VARDIYVSGCFTRGWRVLWSKLFNTVYKDKRFHDIKDRDAEKRNDFKERGTEDLKRLLKDTGVEKEKVYRMQEIRKKIAI
jgi:hypothetical protein